jgi:hypothetical protein
MCRIVEGSVKIREFGWEIPIAGARPRSGEEIARRAAQMNSNGSTDALSCIGRWVAYSIFWWSLSAVDALCETSSDLAGARTRDA